MSNILRVSIISASVFSLAAILVVLNLKNSDPNTFEHTDASGNNTPPLSSVVDSIQRDQQNKIAELITSLNILREEVAYIGGQQQKILEQQREIVETKNYPQFNESMEPIAKETLNNPEPVTSDAEFQAALEQRYTMYDSLYQSGENDPRTVIRIQDAFQVMQTNDGIEVGAVDCSENICRMQTTVTNSDAANEFVNKFPEILPWGTQAAYFITIQPDGSAQVTHFFTTEDGAPLPEYLDEQSG